MAVGGVDEILCMRQRSLDQSREIGPLRDRIGVQGADDPALYAPAFAAAASQPAADEAAVVFGSVAVLFGQCLVLLCSLGCADRAAVAVFQIAPWLQLVFVDLVCFAAADRDFDMDDGAFLLVYSFL